MILRPNDISHPCDLYVRILFGCCCVLCGHDNESRNHLFLSCKLAHQVWGTDLSMSDVLRAVVCWNSELDWAIRNLKERTFISILLRLAWCACVYHLSKERNSRIHFQNFQSYHSVVNSVTVDVSCRISPFKSLSCKISSSELFQVCNNWRIRCSSCYCLIVTLPVLVLD